MGPILCMIVDKSLREGASNLVPGRATYASENVATHEKKSVETASLALFQRHLNVYNSHNIDLHGVLGIAL